MVVMVDVTADGDRHVTVVMDICRTTLFHDYGVVMVMMVVVPVAVVVDYGFVSLRGRCHGKTGHGHGANDKDTNYFHVTCWLILDCGVSRETYPPFANRIAERAVSASLADELAASSRARFGRAFAP